MKTVGSKKMFIITGTTRGLGEAFVSAIMENSKDSIVSVSRSLTEKQKEYDTGRFNFIECDFTEQNIAGKIELFSHYIAGDEIVFISNASLIAPISKVGTFDENKINDLVLVNVKTPIAICNFLLNKFNDRKITVINISSGASTKPIACWSLYCSTKAAMSMFLEVMTQEYPEHKFYTIDPGIMDTDMQLTIRNSEFNKLEEFIKYKEKGLLKSPRVIADQILARVL
ncbi:MAG: SDR family NAD(P)-dependent oxidoreductase [Saprospiraceae bacterium]